MIYTVFTHWTILTTNYQMNIYIKQMLDKCLIWLSTVKNDSEFHLYTCNSMYDNVGSQLPYNHNAFLTYTH